MPPCIKSNIKLICFFVFFHTSFHLANSQSKAAVTSVIQFANTNANKIRFTFSVALGVLSLLILFWSLFLPMIAD